jgi:transcriptional regulator with XRE-family HTH domain
MSIVFFKNKKYIFKFKKVRLFTVTVAERIMSLVKTSGLTITEISSKTGIDKASFTRWKNKDYKPSIDAVVSLAQFFSVSTDWLLTGEGDSTPISVTPADTTEELLLEEYRAADKQKRKAILQAALGTSHEP